MSDAYQHLQFRILCLLLIFVVFIQSTCKNRLIQFNKAGMPVEVISI